jgi:hypothetical protein
VSCPRNRPAGKSEDHIEDPVEQDTGFVHIPEKAGIADSPEAETAAEEDRVQVVPENDVADDG